MKRVVLPLLIALSSPCLAEDTWQMDVVLSQDILLGDFEVFHNDIASYLQRMRRILPPNNNGMTQVETSEGSFATDSYFQYEVSLPISYQFSSSFQVMVAPGYYRQQFRNGIALAPPPSYSSSFATAYSGEEHYTVEGGKISVGIGVPFSTHGRWEFLPFYSLATVENRTHLDEAGGIDNPPGDYRLTSTGRIRSFGFTSSAQAYIGDWVVFGLRTGYIKGDGSLDDGDLTIPLRHGLLLLGLNLGVTF